MEPEELSKHLPTCGVEASGIVDDSRYRQEIVPYSQHPDRVWGLPSPLFFFRQEFLP